MKHRILIIDDDPLILSSTQLLLENHGYRTDAVSNGSEALDRVKTLGPEYSLVLLDYRLKEEEGSEVAKHILTANPDLFVLIYSGDSSRDALKESWASGAVAFLDKGIAAKQLLAEVANWCAKFNETKKIVTLQSSFNEYSDAIASIKMIGRSKVMADIAERVRRYAPMKESVLILGETGTGKEKIAAALHTDGSPFLPVNCAAFSGKTDLMESELFGYEKGAFTGAFKSSTGVFEAAMGGTVFLDEIHALDRVAQQKLLRVLQEKKIRRVGSTQEIPVSFRLLASAKPDLEKLVNKNEFLPDLYERLNVLRISIPSLRERPEDIEPLVAYFCANHEKETGEKRYFLFRTIRYLEKYSWPRNVRELENTVKRLCINSHAEKIAPEQLDAHFFEEQALKPVSLSHQKDDLMKQCIETALADSESQREAARKLQLPESSLRRLIKRLDIKPKLKFESRNGAQ